MTLAPTKALDWTQTAGAARPGWRERAHDGLLIAYLLFSFIGTSPLAWETPAERLQGSSLDRLLAPSMALVALALLWGRRREAVGCLRANGMLVAVIGFAMLSLLWSDYPNLTLRRGLLLILLSVIALGLAASLTSLRRFHAILFGAMLFVILFNLAAVALWPEQAITDLGVAGIYGQKNPAGMVAMIAAIVSVTYAFGAKATHERIYGGVGAALALFFLLLTRSKTSMGLTVVALGVGLTFYLAQRLGPRFALLALAGLIFALANFIGLALANDFEIQKIVGAFIADTSFTGRDQLWAFAWRSVWERPWLGHGYGAFWDVGAVNDPLAKLEPGTWLGDVPSGFINEAHNGYLELALHIGLPMTLLGVGAIFAALRLAVGKALPMSRVAGAQAAYAMMALILSLYLLHNLTEATLLMRGSPFCNLALLLCFAAARRLPGGREWEGCKA